MKVRFLSPTEQGFRVSEVRRRLGMGSVEMSVALGRGRQWLSRIENGQRHIELPRAEAWEIAEFSAGKGDFHSTGSDEIFRYLQGDIDWEVTLVPRISPDDGINSLAEREHKGGYAIAS